MSITLASADLCLTQSAVSRQVHALEEALGVKLLVRRHRSIVFTAEGERLFRVADNAIQQLQDVMGAISGTAARRPVTVTASIGVSGLWLLPRLGRFQKSHPGVDVRIAASDRMVDLIGEGIDLAVRYCPRSVAPMHAIRLFGEAVVPVASPSIGVQALRSAESFAKMFLLEFDGLHRPLLHWGDWLSAMGWDAAKPAGILRFNQYDQVIHAAIAGQGIALGRLALIEPMLADKRLMQLTTPRIGEEDAYAYWLIQAHAEPRVEVSQVVEWIIAEAKRVEVGAIPEGAAAHRRPAKV